MKKKTAFVLLRGLTRDSFHWSGFDQVLAQAFPEADVICLDLPGFGKYFKKKSPLSVAEISKFVFDGIEEKLQGYENKVLFGLSLGGMVALHSVQFDSIWTHCIVVNSSQRAKTPVWHRFNLKNLPRLISGIVSSNPRRLEQAAYEYTINFPKNKNMEVEEWVKHYHKHPFKNQNVFRQLIAASRFKIAKGSEEFSKVKGMILVSKRDRLVGHKSSNVIALRTKWPLFCHETAGHDLTYDDSEWVINKITSFL